MKTLLLTGVTLAAGGATTSPATFSTAFTNETTRLRRDLLGTSGYDKMVPPLSDRATEGVEYSSAGTDIAIQTRFFKVETVRASHGDMRLKIWLRTYWTDLRLSWNPDDYGGLCVRRR